MDSNTRKRLVDVVYNEIINILFVLRVGKKQEVVEREEIISMLFSPPPPTEVHREIAISTFTTLVAAGKIKQVGGRLDKYNYSLSDATWGELSGQLKSVMGDK